MTFEPTRGPRPLAAPTCTRHNTAWDSLQSTPRRKARRATALLSMALLCAAMGYSQTGSLLTSGQPASFSFPTVNFPTLINGSSGYRIVVPTGATQLQVRVNDPTQFGSFFVYLRFGSDVVLTAGGQVLFDQASPNQGSDITVRVAGDSSPPLRAGTYFIAIGVTNFGKGASGIITATVTVPCTYNVVPSTVSVPAPGASGNLTVTTVAGCSWVAASDSSWLTIATGASGSGTGGISYTAAANTTNTGRTGKITVAGQTVAFSQAAALGPTITDVVDGGTFLPNIAPAGWVTIRGSSLASTTRTWEGADFLGNTLPTTLDGTSVSINGKPAAVYYISPTQLNVLAPNDDSTGPVAVTVTTPQGTASSTASLQPLAPSFFMLDPQNRKYVAAVNLDGSIIGPAGLYSSSPNLTKPLVAGTRALVYGTGWGVTDPRQPDGLNFSNGLPLVNASNLHITIGGTPAQVEFAGAVTPGLYQFNIVAPNLATGDYAIVGEINGVRTQSNAFITIQAPPPKPVISVSPQSLTFQATQNGTDPAVLTIALSSNGSPLDFSAAAADSWLTIAQASGTTPAALKIGASIAGLAAGDYSSSIQISTPAASNPSLTVTVALHLAPAPVPPTVSGISPPNMQPGDFTFTFQVTGANLSGGSVEISPPDDLLILTGSASAGLIQGTLVVYATAVPGTRTLSVVRSGLRSNAITFTIPQPSGNFTISNLRAGPTTNSASSATLPITVDFFDSSGAAASGDIRYILQLPGVFISFGSVAARPSGGRNQGTLQIQMNLPFRFTTGRTNGLMISLINSLDNPSNQLSGTFLTQ